MPIGKLYQAPQISFTPVLNAGLNWNQLEQSDRDAFKGIGQKVKLRAGFRLYKFTSGDIESRSGVTPWWSPLGPFQWDSGLENRLRLAQQLGANPADLTRVVAAVRTNWNALTHILTAILRVDVYGFWGQIGWQPKFGDQTLEHMRSFDKVLEELTGRKPQRILLPGGGSQFFIPNLKRNEQIQRGVRVPVADAIAGRVQIF
jgi:hypothetical protein